MCKNILPNTLKLKSQQKGGTIGSWITISHPAVAEIMAAAGFDWLVIDMEHSAIGISAAEHLIRVIQLSCLPVLVRIGENDVTLIKRVMDAGASGIIVPMVNTAEQAVKAVASVKYPPKGIRGVGLARAQGYGTHFKEYQDWANIESTVIVQIEHIEAVNNIEKIINVDGVDGFIVGPYDLSASLGIPGQFDHPKMKEALSIIQKTIDMKIKPGGFHVVMPEVDAAFNKFKEGYSFLAFGVDFIFLGEMCRGKLQELKEQLGKNML